MAAAALGTPTTTLPSSAAAARVAPPARDTSAGGREVRDTDELFSAGAEETGSEDGDTPIRTPLGDRGFAAERYDSDCAPGNAESSAFRRLRPVSPVRVAGHSQ
ncbi:hypothetical protein GCM10023328_34330 [Modestobacter marinus]|uniref:Uncharacterized protein n=1 Tax=Modestobacter marinus TaxID=477641 RepID=A0ABQ2FX92_9ACTN|nr:hypothetical protein GCM10011589_19690 [Modestobacter marinus]